MSKNNNNECLLMMLLLCNMRERVTYCEQTFPFSNSLHSGVQVFAGQNC